MTTRRNVIQFLLGFALVAAMGAAIYLLRPRPPVPSGWQIIRPPAEVIALADAGDVIWAGGRDGLALIDRATGTVKAPPEGLRFSYITSIILENDFQDVWVGHSAGVSYMGSQGLETFTTLDGLPDNQVKALFRTRNGDLWAGTSHGLGVLRAGKWEAYTREDGLASEAVTVLFEDSRNRLWAGDCLPNAGGVSMLEGSTWKIFTTADGLAHNSVCAILEDPAGILWFGTGLGSRGGATRYDGQTWYTLTPADGLEEFRVRSLFIDRQGGRWFGSESAGIVLLDEGAPRLFSPQNGLSGWEVITMLQDRQGDLWFGTENGLTRIRQGFW